MTFPLPIAVWMMLGSAGMLAVALAAMIPIFLHWRAKPKLTERPWAASFLLEAALQKVRGRWGIQQWWLLAIRVAALCLLALALADPQSARVAPAAAVAARTHLVFLLDNTLSMGTVDRDPLTSTDKSRFDRAREAIRRRVQQSTDGDRFSLITLATPASAVTVEPSPAAELFLRELESVTVFHTAAELDKAFAAAESLAQSAVADRVELVIVTDSQAATWNDAAKALEHLATLGSPSWYDVGESRDAAIPDNLAVETLAVEEPLPTVGSELTFSAKIANAGPRAMAGASVSWLVDDQLVGDSQVDVAAHQSSMVYFGHKFATAGRHFVEARLDGDAIAGDNRRWFIVDVPEKRKIAAIADVPAKAVAVVAALDSGESSSEPLSVEIVTPARFAERAREFDGLVVCDVGGFSAKDAAAIRDAVEHGAAAVFLLGNAAQPANYNRLFGNGQESERILPVDLDEPVAAGDFRFEPREYRHAIVRPFAGFERAGLLSCPTWRYIKATLSTSANVERVADFSSGDVACAAATLSRGRVCAWMVAPAVDDEANRDAWSAIGQWPCFPPLLTESLIWTARPREQESHFPVGQEIAVPAPHRDTSDSGDSDESAWSWKRIAPDRSEADPLSAIRGTDTMVRLPPQVHAGVLALQRQPDELRYVAVHFDGSESNLEPVDKTRIPAGWRSQGAGTSGLASSVNPESERFRWSPWLLAAVGLLLLLETAWSNRI